MKTFTPILVHTPFVWYKKSTWISKMIQVVTCCEYSHIAILIDGYVIESIGHEGGVIKTAFYDWQVKNRNKLFRFIPDLPFKNDYSKLIGQGYDYWGGLKMLFFLFSENMFGKNKVAKWFSNYDDQNKWFCSELVGYVAGIENYSLLTPKDFLLNNK